MNPAFLSRVVAFGALLGVAAGGDLLAQSPAQPRTVAQELNPAVFELARDILPSSGIQLTNGIVVFASDWPTLVFAGFTAATPTGPNVGSCTGTLVGPKVLLTAAHCLDNLFYAPRTASLKVDGRELALICEQHPVYAAREITFRVPKGSEDFALCRIDDQGVIPATLTAMEFEVVNVETSPPPGEPVLLTGYGCSNLHFENGRLASEREPQVLRIGDERIETTAGVPDPTNYVTVRSNALREPALCPGDSGGPMFTGVTSQDPTGPRRLRGVNSRVDPAPGAAVSHDVISSVAATGNDTFRTWARDWLRRTRVHGTTICGLNARAGQGRCRS